MNPATVEYLKGRVISAVPKTSGEIVTHTTITFDNNVIAEGCATRDIGSYDKTEADNAAFLDAIATLLPGIEFARAKID